MNNIIIGKSQAGAELVTAGTERFNVIFQEYPVKFMVSKARKVKLIQPKDLKKYDKFVERTPGSDRTPPEYRERVEKGIFSWRVAGKKERLYDNRKNADHLVNRLQQGLNDEVYGWFTRNSKQYLGYAVRMANGVLIPDATKGYKGFVMANPKAAGTERWVAIRGQDYWMGGEGVIWNRDKFKEFMVAYYGPIMSRHLPETIYPPKDHFIHLEYIFYVPIKLYTAYDENRMGLEDIDNHSYPYIKTFMDTLTTLGIIKSDDPRVVRGHQARYVEVEKAEDRRMEVRFHFCKGDQQIIPRMYTVGNAPTNFTYNHLNNEEDPFA